MEKLSDAVDDLPEYQQRQLYYKLRAKKYKTIIQSAGPNRHKRRAQRKAYRVKKSNSNDWHHKNRGLMLNRAKKIVKEREADSE